MSDQVIVKVLSREQVCDAVIEYVLKTQKVEAPFDATALIHFNWEKTDEQVHLTGLRCDLTVHQHEER